MRRRWFPILGTLALAVASLFLLNNWICPVRIHGKSMEPTLQDGSLLLADRLGKISRGDLIAFYTADRQQILVKRVLAQNGEALEIHEGRTYIDGILYPEPYLTEPDMETAADLTVPLSEYYVLGDNRKVSRDSRNKEIGTISKKQIIGKIILKFPPVNRT